MRPQACCSTLNRPRVHAAKTRPAKPTDAPGDSAYVCCDVDQLLHALCRADAWGAQLIDQEAQLLQGRNRLQ